MPDICSLRPLGSTPLQVTRIGLGLAALGRPAYITLGRDRDIGDHRSQSELESRCHDMLDAGYAAGIRYVDCARSYGQSEAFVASWLRLRRLAPGSLRIGSKWGYAYVGQWHMNATIHESKDLSVEQLRHQIAESRGWLGDALGLYQIHSATIESGVLDDRRVLEALLTLRESGLVIGLSVSGPRQAEAIRRAIDVRIDGVHLFQSVQATWNLLETSAGDALADARSAGLGVIVKEALANGRLSDRNMDPSLDAARRFAAAQQMTLDAVAIAAALAQPWADVVLSGAVTRDQLQSNLQALDHAIAADAVPAIAETPALYWTRRGALPWQ